MELTKVNIEDLKPAKYNPRKQLTPNDDEYQSLKRSIETFGYADPVIVNKDMTVIGGHQRLNVLKDLDFKELDVIVLNLNKTKEKALNVALNKVSGDWDEYKLKELFQDLEDDYFDLNLTGFDDLELADLFDEEEQEEIDYKEKTQELTENILNLGVAQFSGVGYYDIPQIEPLEELPEGIEEWIGFNYVLSDKDPSNKAVHFFVDDYQFERVWNRPDAYIEKLRQYKCVLAPDFSPYGDMPLATQLFNHYRKHWVACYWQAKGIKVIPTIRSSTDERSLNFYLDGEPVGGVVAYSSMWCMHEAIKDVASNEYNTMIDELQPKTVILYGEEYEWMNNEGIEVIKIPTFATDMVKRITKEAQDAES